MPYVVRILQRFNPADRAEFLRLESRFAALERQRTDFPKGRRFQPFAGREAANTLIWTCEFPSLEEARGKLALMSSDPAHEALFREQAPLITAIYTEIFEQLEFPTAPAPGTVVPA